MDNIDSIKKQKPHNKYIKLLIEIIYYVFIFVFLFVIKNTYSISNDYDLIMYFSFVLILFSLFLVSGSHFNKYIGLIFSFVYTLYLVAQNIYYRGFKSWFRFSTAFGLAKEVSEVGGAIKELITFSDIIPFIVLLVVSVLFIVLHYCFQNRYYYKWYIRIICVPLIVISVLLVNNMIKKIEATKEWQIDKSDFYLYDTMNNPGAFVEKFGLITFGYRDFQITFVDKADFDEYKEEIDLYFLNKESKDTTNDYTGLFEGKSLFIIQAESLMNVAISEDLTPTLYNLMNNGIVISNYDSPLLAGSTSDAEFMVNTSMIPETDGYPVCYKYSDNIMPNTLGNKFKDLGYKTYAFHNNYAEYYNRAVMFDKYGYDFYDSYRLGLENLESDSTLSDQIAWIISEQDKFMTYWITYSGHQPYTLEETGVSKENVARVKEKYPGLDDNYVSYFAKQMDLDQAISYIYNDVLNWVGKKDDVILIVIGDHTSKSINCEKGSNFDEVIGKNWKDDPKDFYTPCVIYGTNIEHKTIEKYMSALDLMPTILNLWNIEYDNKYVFGNDVFDTSYDGFSFDVDGNYFNSYFQYKSSEDQVELLETYFLDKANQIVKEFDKKREICKKILQIDYFRNSSIK